MDDETRQRLIRLEEHIAATDKIIVNMAGVVDKLLEFTKVQDKYNNAVSEDFGTVDQQFSRMLKTFEIATAAQVKINHNIKTEFKKLIEHVGLSWKEDKDSVH